MKVFQLACRNCILPARRTFRWKHIFLKEVNICRVFIQKLIEKFSDFPKNTFSGSLKLMSFNREEMFGFVNKKCLLKVFRIWGKQFGTILKESVFVWLSILRSPCPIKSLSKRVFHSNWVFKKNTCILGEEGFKNFWQKISARLLKLDAACPDKFFGDVSIFLWDRKNNRNFDLKYGRNFFGHSIRQGRQNINLRIHEMLRWI